MLSGREIAYLQRKVQVIRKIPDLGDQVDLEASMNEIESDVMAWQLDKIDSDSHPCDIDITALRHSLADANDSWMRLMNDVEWRWSIEYSPNPKPFNFL